MPEDPKWELAILQTVYGLYQKLLREALQEDVPVPIGLDAAALRQPGSDLVTIALLRRWLKLLDLAIAPPLLRHGLSGAPQQETAEALLCYYAHKKNPGDHDRDKLDFVATYLYRNPRVAGQWESKGFSLDGIVPVPPFEIALLEILQDAELPTLPEEHVQLLRELDSLRAQVEKFGEFDELMESGVIARVREMKQLLGRSFYHPHVLAALASYNAYFGGRFDELFRTAAQRIKEFAQQVQMQGGSSLSPVEGGVMVKHLEEVEEHSLLKAEYRHAHERFHHVSKLKRAVDRRTGKRAAHQAKETGTAAAATASANAVTPPAQPATAAPAAGASAQAKAAASVGSSAIPIPTWAAVKKEVVMPMATNPSQRSHQAMEESKLRGVEESIRAFVRAADPRFRQVVPMRFGNLVMSPAEADAYCADHLEEKSFRADNARCLVQNVALLARITTELSELEQKRNSAHLWKPHADALMFLVERAREMEKQNATVVQVAQQRGLAEKVNALNTSAGKLREKSELALKALAVGV